MLTDEQRKMLHAQLRRYLAQECATLTTFSKEVGVSVATASRWLAGKSVPSADAVVKISRVLGVDVSVLYDGEAALVKVTKRKDGAYFVEVRATISEETARELAPMLKRVKEESSARRDEFMRQLNRPLPIRDMVPPVPGMRHIPRGTPKKWDRIEGDQ